MRTCAKSDDTRRTVIQFMATKPAQFTFEVFGSLIGGGLGLQKILSRDGIPNLVILIFLGGWVWRAMLLSGDSAVCNSLLFSER